MNKNTIIGLGLIGLILALFSYFNQPTPEQLKKQKEKQEQLAQQKAQEIKKQEEDSAQSTQKKLTQDSLEIKAQKDTTTIQSQAPTSLAATSNKPEQTVVLQNDKIKVVLSNKGGGVKSVFLKHYQTYNNFIKNEGTDKIVPIQLFDEKKATNSIELDYRGKRIETRDITFKIADQSDEKIAFVADLGQGKKIKQIYTIQPGKYDIGYKIQFEGLKNVDPDDVYLNWQLAMLKTERLLSQQRISSTVFYQTKAGDYEYLSESGDDEGVAETDINWVAFKQSYFSSIMMPEKSFKKDGTTFTIRKIKEGTKEDSTLIKSYGSTMNLALNSTANGSVNMRWFFGPNNYDLLQTYNNGTEDLLNYGWGLFRWINIYIIHPIFEWLVSFGMNIGIAILILTVIVKTCLTPIQWKMYVSSAKMKILKPEIEEINKKYPNKEDAMAKQSETMSLYKESGASPLSGCLPMLIQAPILFAVFRFFPSTFAIRQQGFLWAEDLSTYDSVLDLGFSIPFYGSHVSLFTLLMAATTLIYTVYNSNNQMQPSQPGMPNMKFIMYLFPIMMIFFFNNYSSGLSFYYFVSTSTSIITMLIIKKYFVDEEKIKLKMADRKEARQKSGKKKSKSKFQQRLEEMQKAQQEKLKNTKKNKK